MYVDDLFAFLRMEPRIRSAPDALPAPRPILRGLEFRHVSFRYPGAERDALHDVSFLLRPGQRIAVIGENGAGKTTLTKLIARLYDPTEGQVLLDGVDLRAYDLEDWRREIGVIFQDYMRYNMLLWENIAMGRVELSGDRPRIEKAARLSPLPTWRRAWRKVWTRWSAVASPTASIYPAESGRRSPWPAPICATPSC